MNENENDRDRLKRQAAERAVEMVESGMVVGLGSGSTATFAIRRLGELLAAGQLHDIVGYPTSSASEAEARRLRIPIVPLDWPPLVDLTIDGADEVDDDLNLIKGGGGALLREKIVAQASHRVVIVVDEEKISHQLGTQWPLPVEVIPFAWGAQARFLESLGAKVAVRQAAGGGDYHTDQGNFILDCRFGIIERPHELANQLAQRAGIVEHGLFLDLTTELVVAGRGGVQRLTRK